MLRPASRMVRRTPRPPPAAADGFSLVEVLIATGVLVTAIAALMHLFVVAARATAEARDATYAAVLAAQKIEELRGAPFPAHDASTDYLDARGVPLADGSGDRVGTYERRWTVGPLATGRIDTVVITVDVRRTGAASHRAVRLTTLRTRRME